MSLSRAMEPGQAIRRCACGHVIAARVGDMCPRPGCHRLFPDLGAIHDALRCDLRAHGVGGTVHVARALGVEGDRLVSDGRRVFGVVTGGAA